MAEKVYIANRSAIAEIDPLDYQIFLEIEHHKVHVGRHFCLSDYDGDVDIGAKYWLLRTPSEGSLWHWIFTISCGKHGLVEAFWNPNIAADGTPITFINNNFNSLNDATILCFKDPTVTDDGNRFFVRVLGDDIVGASKGSGDKVERSHERIFRPGKDYLFKFTALADNTRVSVEFEVYN